MGGGQEEVTIKILLHTNSLNRRGTTVSTIDYAKWLRQEFDYECIISYTDSDFKMEDVNTAPEVKREIEKKFELRPIRSITDIETVTKDVDFAYFQRSGYKDFLPKNTRTGVHSVFAVDEPHGDVYAYISSWLSHYMSDFKTPYVPYIVDLPKATGNFRKHLGISDEQIVIGRYGGYTTFDLDFAKQAVRVITDHRKDVVFLMLNTKPFILHNNVIYLKPIYDLQKKSNFINTCDGFLHARIGGESFGLSILEPLLFNKPVLSWYNGTDKNHLELFAGTGLLYDHRNLIRKLLNIRRFNGTYAAIVEQFNPYTVINKFKEVFLVN